MTECDVLVIGGGPAGSTIATLLAKKGWRVVVLEKETFPRFHIGESLLPLNLPILEDLGVAEQVRDIGIVKYGAEFNSVDHDKPVTYYFAGAFNKQWPHAYEVKRSQFDQILLNNCKTHKVVVREATKVVAVDFLEYQNIEVKAQNQDNNAECWKTRFVVDASGRETFMAKKFSIQNRNPDHSSAAIFAHFTGVERRLGKDEGNISVYWFEHGWFWVIPFQDEQVSVGAVCWPYYLKSRNKPVDEFLWDTIAQCPLLLERMKNATIAAPATATGNYSYAADRMAGNDYLMIGDAYAFVDPVFSSGVLLAMNGGMRASELVHSALDSPEDLALIKRKTRQFEKMVKYGIKTFSWFIFRITQPAMRNMFMAPRPVLKMKEGILSLLAGDLFGKAPIKTPLFMFKVIYYVSFMFNWKENMRAYKKRKRSNAHSDKSKVTKS